MDWGCAQRQRHCVLRMLSNVRPLFRSSPAIGLAAAARILDLAAGASRPLLCTTHPLPPMLVEALTALLLVVSRPAQVSAWLAWTGLALVGVIWLSTAALQVPAHGRLVSGFDAEVGSFLVTTNWIRTVAWSARAAVVCAMLMQALAPARS